MTTFNHGDHVISATQKDITLEAQVDFETPEGKVYISEWGKNLNNPMRIVLDKKYLIKKEKKVILTRDEFQKLIFEFYPNPVTLDELDRECTPTEGFIFRDRGCGNLEYIGTYGGLENEYIFRYYNTNPKEDRDDKYFVITQNDLQQGVVKTKDVLNYLFGNDDTSMFDVVLDNNENTNDENI